MSENNNNNLYLIPNNKPEGITYIITFMDGDEIIMEGVKDISLLDGFFFFYDVHEAFMKALNTSIVKAIDEEK